MTDLDDGDKCPSKCGGTMKWSTVENCSCHINPPCAQHENQLLFCDTCGWEDLPEAPTPPVRSETIWMQKWREDRAKGTTLPGGGRVFNVDHDGRSGCTHVITGNYEGPITSAEIIALFGDGTFGHRDPTFANGRFRYTKVTD